MSYSANPLIQKTQSKKVKKLLRTVSEILKFNLESMLLDDAVFTFFIAYFVVDISESIHYGNS